MLRKIFAFCLTVASLFFAAEAAAAIIKLAPPEGPPGSETAVAGKSFQPGEIIDVYFDTADAFVAVANAKGRLVRHELRIPAGAQPGTHWVTAMGRTSGAAVQRPFAVHADWRSFGFTAQGGRNNGFESIVGQSNVAKLATAWSADISSSSSAAVADGSVYVGSSDANLYAYDVATGAKRWSFPTNGSVASSPAVDGDLVFFGSDDATVYAVTTAGKLVWQSEATGGKVEGSPVVADGKVFIGSDDKNLYAFDEKSGEKKWNALTGGAIRGTPAVADGVVYVGSYGRYVYALNEWTGERIRRYKVNGQVNGSPAVVNGILYVGSGDGNIYAFNLDGSALWSFPTTAYVAASVTVANGVVYAASTNGQLFAIDPHKGQQIWSVSDPFNTSTYSSPAYANGVLYLGGMNGGVYAYDASNGALLWFAAKPAAVYASPTVSDGVVYVGSHNANGAGRFDAYSLNGQLNGDARRSAPPSYALLWPNRALVP
ncbi:MAG: PQQ-binding-like beta-propeller repeat protein [Alphaproteobacteria bacterium]|nr:PQQ-binding-like beta-propeller repeat protein [Alphaproteobacteria bacterium]